MNILIRLRSIFRWDEREKVYPYIYVYTRVFFLHQPRTEIQRHVYYAKFGQKTAANFIDDSGGGIKVNCVVQRFILEYLSALTENLVKMCRVVSGLFRKSHVMCLLYSVY